MQILSPFCWATRCGKEAFKHVRVNSQHHGSLTRTKPTDSMQLRVHCIILTVLGGRRWVSCPHDRISILPGCSFNSDLPPGVTIFAASV